MKGVISIKTISINFYTETDDAIEEAFKQFFKTNERRKDELKRNDTRPIRCISIRPD